MPSNKDRPGLPPQASSVAVGRYTELDKDESQGFTKDNLIFEMIEKIEDLEARVSALEP